MLFIRSAVDIILSDYPSSGGLFYLLLTGLWLVFLGVDSTLSNPRSYRSSCRHTCPPGWTMSIIMIWSFFPVIKNCLVFGPENVDQFEYWSPKAAWHPRSKLFFPLYTLLEPGPFHGPKVPRGYFTCWTDILKYPRSSQRDDLLQLIAGAQLPVRTLGKCAAEKVVHKKDIWLINNKMLTLKRKQNI